jgi:hypothetical protein
LTPPDSESPLAAESVPIDASGLYKIAHSVDGNGSGKGNPATATRSGTFSYLCPLCVYMAQTLT